MNIQLNDFEGPFDLLLHLVRVAKMDIYNINIKEIIDQYLNFINSIPKNNIDIASEYLVMSSELIHLKSKMLVHKNDEEEEDDKEYIIKSEEDLRNKLIEYEKYKHMTETFKRLEEKRSLYYTKVPENLDEYRDGDKVINSNVSLDELLQAFLDMQKRMAFKKPLATRVTGRELSVKERVKEIRKILDKKGKREFTELFDVITKEGIVVTFLAILDMSKNREITIKQDRVFSIITIERVELQ